MYMNRKEGQDIALGSKDRELLDRIIRAENFLSIHVVVSRTVNALRNYYSEKGITISVRTIREDIRDAQYLFGAAFTFNKDYERFFLTEIQKKILVHCLGDLNDNSAKDVDQLLGDSEQKFLGVDVKGANAAIKNLIVLGGFDRVEPERINPDDIKAPTVIATDDPEVLGIKSPDSEADKQALLKKLREDFNFIVDADAELLNDGEAGL